MDGRYEECYYDREFDKLIAFIAAEEGWEQAITDYPTQILMPEKTTNIYEFLKNRPEWKLVYDGPCAGVFLPAKIAKKEYKLPFDDLRYYRKTLFDTNGEFGKKDEERLINE